MLRAVRQNPDAGFIGRRCGRQGERHAATVSALAPPDRPPPLSRLRYQRDQGRRLPHALLRLEIWKDQFGLGWEDNLCLQCIERRLGRRITMHDTMNGIPTVAGHPMSAALYDRIVAPLLPKQRRRKAKPKRRAG